MQKFSQLINRLLHARQESTKRELLINYFTQTPDPDRGYALAILLDTINIDRFSSKQLRQLITDKFEAKLFELSLPYVGDLAETIALLWPDSNSSNSQNLSQIVRQLIKLTKTEQTNYVADLLSACNVDERWVILKLLTGKLNTLVTTQTLKRTLAIIKNTSVHDIEQMMYQAKPPYHEFFDWLSGKTIQTTLHKMQPFLTVMEAKPITQIELQAISLSDYQIEYHKDGMRIQLIAQENYKVLLNMVGEDISKLFPELLPQFTCSIVLDGELIIKSGNANDLRQRLKNTQPSQHVITKYPVHIQIHDMLMLDGKDLRGLSFYERQFHLRHWYSCHTPANLQLAEKLKIDNSDDLKTLFSYHNLQITGLILKRLNSHYSAGIEHSDWLIWKRDPFVIDAVLMYAQRGQGRYANFYAEYTLGLWQDSQLLPIAKPYLDIPEQEIKRIDNWIKKHTTNRFGPVRAVIPHLVFELAFEAVHTSKRHVSGLSLQFPTVKQVRWDKPALAAAQLSSLQYYVAN